jgi:hypothetical protein
VNFLEASGDLICRCDISLSRWTYRLVVFLAVVYSSNPAVRAQDISKTGYDDKVVSFFEKNPQASSGDPFSRGNVELEFLGGGESSSLYPGARRPKITCRLTGARSATTSIEIIPKGLSAEASNLLLA